MPCLPDATAATPRRLLALARDLQHAPDQRTVLELTGPAVQELLLADGALLLLALGAQAHVTEFDHNGVMQTAGENTALYRHARKAIENETPILLPDMAVDPPRGVGIVADHLKLRELAHGPGCEHIPLDAWGYVAITPYDTLRQQTASASSINKMSYFPR